MSYSHWLMKKRLWPIARQNNTRQESQTEKREEEGCSMRDVSQLPKKQDDSRVVKPRPRGKA